MKILEELLPGTLLLQPRPFTDQRGVFVKTFHETTWKKLGLSFSMQEEFYSVSHKDVLRGMHFQTPPFHHEKVVYCLKGEVLDVLLDLRKGSTYGKVAATRLSGSNARMVVVPKGVAHGFLALTDEASVVYKTSTEHAPANDCGVRWDSFGFDWQCPAPIMSQRDQEHPPLAQFDSPF